MKESKSERHRERERFGLERMRSGESDTAPHYDLLVSFAKKSHFCRTHLQSRSDIVVVDRNEGWQWCVGSFCKSVRNNAARSPTQSTQLQTGVLAHTKRQPPYRAVSPTVCSSFLQSDQTPSRSLLFEKARATIAHRRRRCALNYGGTLCARAGPSF